MNSAKIFFIVFMFVCSGTCSSFIAFGEYEYLWGKHVVSNYSTAEEQCTQANATLAIVNSPNITNFLVQRIVNLTREY